MRGLRILRLPFAGARSVGGTILIDLPFNIYITRMEKGFQFLKKGLLSGVKVLNSIIYDAISPSLLLLFWTLSEALYLFALLNSFYFTFKIENQAAAFLAKTLNLFTFAFYKDLQSAQNPSKIPPL